MNDALHAVIRQEDDNCAPPGQQVLVVSVVSGVVFLSIASYEESSTETKLTSEATVAVNIEVLLDQLCALSRSDVRTKPSEVSDD